MGASAVYPYEAGADGAPALARKLNTDADGNPRSWSRVIWSAR